MKKERKNILKHKERVQENLGNSRRGFLQKCALVTGAFVVGVLRLDRVMGDESEGESGEEYCCYLVADYKRDCLTQAECIAKFYWICPYKNERGVRYIIKCVECFNVDIPSDIDSATHQCRSAIREYRENLECAVALHPDFDDYGDI